MKNKLKFREAVFEIVCELVLTLVCFGFGALILHLFGVDGKALFEIDPDIVALVGIGIFLAIFIASYFLVQLIKKRKK